MGNRPPAHPPTAVATYEYDPYGNIVSQSGDLADLNPLRYRGYYYDAETGFYYLQSRYYDPAIARFINADSYASTGQGFIGYNMFAYCRNNPASRIDLSGTADEVCYNNNGEVFDNNDLTGLDGGGGMKSTYVSGVTNHSNGGNGTGSMIGDIAYIDAKAAATTYIPTWGWEEIISYFLSMFSGQKSSSSQCFVEGTLVQTAEGTTAIESIEVGDYVWAWDEESRDVALKEVVETYVNQTCELIHVFVNGEKNVTTPEHPFYSPVKGWITAVHLRAGDILVLVNGEYVVVEKIQHEILENPVTVYNFQVEGYHTYYVSDSGVLVHNTCHPNGKYEDAPYHSATGNPVKSAKPIDGQTALDNSVQVKSTSPTRIGISNNQFVVLMQTRPGLFHGHVRQWGELTIDMQHALINSGFTNWKGKIK